MLLSDAHATPFGSFTDCSFCFVPAEMSITEPAITTGWPNVSPACGADTVVCVGPLPTA